LRFTAKLALGSRKRQNQQGAEARRRVTDPQTTGGDSSAPPQDPRYVSGWSRLVRASMLSEVASPAVDPAWFDSEVGSRAVLRARRQAAQAVFADRVCAGSSLETATYLATAALTAARLWNDAWALGEGVGRLPGGETARTVGLAVLAHRRRQLERVWRLIAGLDEGVLLAHLVVEAVDAGLARGDEAGRDLALAIASRADRLREDQAVQLAGRFLVTGHRDVSRSLVSHVRTQDLSGLHERQLRSLDLVGGWLNSAHEVPPDAVPMAVIDYQSPDQEEASGNVGDYIQTLALLGNVARMSGMTITGEDGLGDLVRELRSRVRPDLLRPDDTGRIHLLPVSRECTSLEALPARTWMVAFGWHMHPLFGLRTDFPYHPNIRPLFVSFHVNRLDTLTDEALDYLRSYGPVGCRDWTTVFLLLSAGVDAFFTGCLTTTVDAVFPARDEVYAGQGPVGVIDLGPRAAGRDAARARIFSHQADEYRHMSLSEGVRAASELLQSYQRTLDRAVTNRLHAYLPLTALGVPVRFRPNSPGDVRFPGLTRMRPGGARLRRVQRGIRHLLAETLAKVGAGAAEEEVYALWRELTVARVEEAKDRFTQDAPSPSADLDLPGSVARCLAGSRRFGPRDSMGADGVTDVVMSFDDNLRDQAPVTMESIVANATGPVRFWLMVRGVDEHYWEWVASCFPSVPITFLPCDHVDFGTVVRKPDRITISTMDRLLLPELLGQVDRVVYLDIDVVVLGDVSTLSRTDLRGTPLAARASDVSGVSEWRSAARRLPEDAALELQRRMGRRHGLRYAALNAGVLVLDLARMRADGFTGAYLGWVDRYGLHDQDILLAYVGPDRADIDPAWNALPALEDVRDPKIIHWAGLGKPWEEQLTYAAELWRGYEERLRRRAGTPPHGGREAVGDRGSQVVEDSP
jgi:lipopolysaccharide biosynthesis glycosyltransferase